MMRKLLFIFVLIQIILISTSCTKYDQRLEITTPGSPQVILLHKKPNQKNVHSMGIHCYGLLEGEAQLVLMLNGVPYKTEHMKGKVNFEWGGDWYSDSMELRYQPRNVASGHVKIDYTFADI